jgi:hypothetical protein
VSTKSSITWGNGYHLYKEVLDEYNCYLELDHEELYFIAKPQSIIIAIPKYIMDAICEAYIKQKGE